MASARKKAKKKVTKKATHLERLHAAGVLKAEDLTEKEKKLVNRMPRREIDMLISIRRKRGPAPKGREEIRPNFFL
jgi:hypothetical protein